VLTGINKLLHAALVIAGGWLTTSGPVHAQSSVAGYPSKPIRVLVPFAPGGGADLMARLIAPRMSERLGQTVVVDNRPAASGIVATEMAAHAAPDGHTLLVLTSNHAAHRWMYKKLSFDPSRDFEFVTQATISPLVVVIHPSVPANTLQEFIKYTRANPAKINYGSSGPGGPPHLAGAMLNMMANINMTHIVYKGVAPAIIALLGNEVQLSFTNVFSGQPHIKSGRLRILGITSLKRLQSAPDWPTISEAGVPGYEASIWYGFALPAKTPPAIINVVHKEITAILNRPEVRQTFESQGGEVIASTPQEFTKTFRDDQERLGKVIKAAGIVAE